MRLSIVNQEKAVWELEICGFGDGCLDEPDDFCLAPLPYVVGESLWEWRIQSPWEDFFNVFVYHGFLRMGGWIAMISPFLRGHGALLPVGSPRFFFLLVPTAPALWEALAIAPRPLRLLAACMALGGCHPSYLCDVICSACPMIFPWSRRPFS